MFLSKKKTKTQYRLFKKSKIKKVDLLFTLLTFSVLFAACMQGLKMKVESGEVKANAFPAVFIINHQDDELWLAGAIKEHVDSGRPTHVVLATTGDNSYARHIINGKTPDGKPVYCHQHDKYHIPSKEGYKELSLQDFTAARNMEFIESMKKLQVPMSNIHFANQDLNPNLLPGETYETAWAHPRFIDQQLTTAQANEIISYYFNKIGEGGYMTIAAGAGSPYSDYVNPDHKVMYLALWNYKDISDKRFYTNIAFGAKKVLTPTQKSAKASALNQYRVWKPSSKKYAIGHHSVQRLFETWMTNGVEYVFADKTPPKPPTNFTAKRLTNGSMSFAWDKPVVSDLAGVIVVKSRFSHPNKLSEGKLIYKGNGNNFVEKPETRKGRYYYSIFSYDTVGNVSTGKNLYLRSNSINTTSEPSL